MFEVKRSTSVLTDESAEVESLVTQIPWESLKPGKSVFIPYSIMSNYYADEKAMFAHLRPAATRKGKRYGYVFKVISHKDQQEVEIGCKAESSVGEKARAKYAIRQDNSKQSADEERVERAERYKKASDEIDQLIPFVQPGTPEFPEYMKKHRLATAELFNQYEAEAENPIYINIEELKRALNAPPVESKGGGEWTLPTGDG